MQQILLLIILIMSVLSFILFGIDKWKATHHAWRIPEATLLLFAFLLGGPGALLGMLVFHHKTRKWKFRILVPLFTIVEIILAVFFLWTGDYYHADQTAMAAMESDENVTVKKTSSGWLFDGPSGDSALIFYPGGKVEAASYAPMLHELAADGEDVYLVQMPMNLAVFGMDRAEDIIDEASYDSYYIGGHSLGGAMAASYAASHPDELDGVVLMAAYPTKELSSALDVTLIYGSEDKVLDVEKAEKTREYTQGKFAELVIKGGNHAQFGNYGEQKGDGKASITAEEQQTQTINMMIENCSHT